MPSLWNTLITHLGHYLKFTSKSSAVKGVKIRHKCSDRYKSALQEHFWSTWDCRCHCFQGNLRFGSQLHRVVLGWCRCWLCWQKTLCGFLANRVATRGLCHCLCECRSPLPTCWRDSHQWHYTQCQIHTVMTARLYLGGPGSPLQQRTQLLLIWQLLLQ